MPWSHGGTRHGRLRTNTYPHIQRLAQPEKWQVSWSPWDTWSPQASKNLEPVPQGVNTQTSNPSHNTQSEYSCSGMSCFLLKPPAYPRSSWRVHWFFKFLRVLDWDFLGNSDSEISGWVPGIPVFRKPPRWFQWWPLFGNECCQPQILWTALECPRPLMMPYVFWTLWAPFHPFDGSCPLQNNKYW